MKKLLLFLLMALSSVSAHAAVTYNIASSGIRTFQSAGPVPPLTTAAERFASFTFTPNVGSFSFRESGPIGVLITSRDFTAGIVGDRLSIDYSYQIAGPGVRDTYSFNLGAQFLPGYLIDGFPSIVDFSQMVDGSFRYNNTLCSVRCDSNSFSGNIRAFVVTSTTGFSPASASLASTFVPEPATWLMLVGGFGLIGGTLRKVRIRRPEAVY